MRKVFQIISIIYCKKEYLLIFIQQIFAKLEILVQTFSPILIQNAYWKLIEEEKVNREKINRTAFMSLLG